MLSQRKEKERCKWECVGSHLIYRRCFNEIPKRNWYITGKRVCICKRCSRALYGWLRYLASYFEEEEDATIELTKVAKVLSAMDGGEDIKNKKIDTPMCFDEMNAKLVMILMLLNLILFL